MVVNRHFAAALTILLFVVVASQGTGEERPEEAVNSGDRSGALSRNYYFRLDTVGTPSFTQVIAWSGDPNAREYGLFVRDISGAILVEARTSESSFEVHLQPGNYAYKIVTYNLLGKAEVQTDWIDLNVIKAEQPVIAEVSPNTLYMDSLDVRVKISGANLLREGEVTLVSEAGKKYDGRVVERAGDSDIVVVFSNEAYRPGLYTIHFENPGGLFSDRLNALAVRPQRPIDIFFSAGYAPFIPLGDEWFLQNWNGTLNPIAASAQLSGFFVKRRWGFVGAELGGQWWRIYGGDEGNAITSDFVLASISLAYKYRFTRYLHGLVRLGGGVSLSNHTFVYDGSRGSMTDSRDPHGKAGIALQVLLPFKLFAELGVDWCSVFFKDDQIGGVVPRIGVGYQLY